MVLNFCRYNSFVVFKSVTFEKKNYNMESVGFDANNDLQGNLEIFKSETFKNYKRFVPAEVQNQYARYMHIYLVGM